MKSGYFVHLPNDICCFFAKFLGHRVKNEKVMTKTSSQLNAPVLTTEPPYTTLLPTTKVTRNISGKRKTSSRQQTRRKNQCPFDNLLYRYPPHH